MKNLVKISIVMLLLAVIFAGCKKDKNEPSDIAGTYSGSFSMAGVEVVPNAKLNIVRVDDTNITITVNEDFPVIGQLSISCPATVTKSDNTYQFNGTTTVTIEMLGGSFPVNIDGTATEAGAINMTISGEGLPADVTFAGEKQ